MYSAAPLNSAESIGDDADCLGDRRGARVGVGDVDGVRGCGARVDGVRCLAERVVQAGENGAGRPGAGDHEFGVAGVPEPGADGERRGGDAVDRVDDYDALDDEREREQLLGGSPYASAREEHLVSGPDDRLIRWDAVAGGQGLLGGGGDSLRRRVRLAVILIEERGGKPLSRDREVSHRMLPFTSPGSGAGTAGLPLRD